jgi:dipeptidyl aminopeptidase/acylaminoacyl peptidase
MSSAKIAPYGSWASPITADLITRATVGVGAGVFDGHDIYWLEGRPLEQGRQVLVRRTADGKTTDVNPAPFNARTRVHEYGGGSYLVHQGIVYFCNFADQRLYRVAGDSQPRPLTPAVDVRYADFALDERRQRLICVREDHTGAGEAVNTLVSLPLPPSTATDIVHGGDILASGYNFYSSPRLNKDGTRLAWLSWNHPNMPWDGCELWVATVQSSGALDRPTLVAGGLVESIFQPEWAPDGNLYFISDRTGWWNIYRWREGKTEAMGPRQAEFGLPQWVFGMSTYAVESSERLVCTYREDGAWRLGVLHTETRRLEPIELPYTDISGVHAEAGRVLLVGASASQPAALVLLDLTSHQTTVLRRSYENTIDSGYFSTPQEIEFSTEHGLTAFGYYYPPQNPQFAAPASDRPPLLVLSHGGPTAATSTSFSLSIQYWTTRGFAVLDVNYGGSTGYGRAYRQRLNGQWGVVDMDDCANGANHLVQRGLVDGKRIAIRGGSAGGYTTLCALTFRNTFTAGASHFGISDLTVFVKDTHKFESRYLDRLVGPYPERKDLYDQRSALNYLDRISAPLILFQGLEDKIVPPNQAELMFEAVKAKGIPVAYLPFEGEQHGFRQAKNIKRALEAELYFYSKVFRFPLAESIEPVHIENLA